MHSCHLIVFPGGNPMLFLVAALLLLGTFIGTPAFLPLPATAAAATAVALWLLVFAARERRSRTRRTS
ncbi:MULTISPECIES: hypothetical protein [unclassified Streptomyces]|uniref:hypothetical protein n=1 Tax=unclassified Streptomyces TaxID=2593676 RepID=UPI001113F64B|nr:MULTISPECIES: hypothetical protein [unclassified Streptomyces]